MTHSDTLPRPIAVVGPTASGKTELALNLAERLGGEIINVDSMQLYRGMDIGTAKTPPHERRGIPHHQIDVLPVTAVASVARFQRDAVRDVDAVRARGRVPIMVGGSMLYAQSLLDNWDFPPTDARVRAGLERRLREEGLAALHAELARKDPAAAAIIEDNDPRRTIRALEVGEITGKPFPAKQPDRTAMPRWNTHIVGLATTSEWLHPRIERRTHAMFAAGLIDEVEELVGCGLTAHSTAGRAIGYAQVLAMRAGELTEEEAREKTIIGTRRYVRRQRAWFRRDPRITWLDAQHHVVDQALDSLQ